METEQSGHSQTARSGGTGRAFEHCSGNDQAINSHTVESSGVSRILRLTELTTNLSETRSPAPPW